VDVVYDHFLATDPVQFPGEDSLAIFSEETYLVLSAYQQVSPPIFNRVLPFMISHNWLYNYQFLEGIRRSFEGLARRAKFINESEKAFAIFERHYMELGDCYRHFFPELKDFSYNHLQLLLKE
jgi:acyl carrier protein phosphodiesterase